MLRTPVLTQRQPSKELQSYDDKAFQELCKSIFIAIPYRPGENITISLTENIAVWARFGIRVCTMKDVFGGFIEVTRGHMVSTFMEFASQNPECDKMIFIDSDESMDWWVPLELAKHDLPVVSGVVPGYNSERGTFACFMKEDETGTPRFPLARANNPLPRTGVTEVHTVGAGLLCVKKEVFEKIESEFDISPFFIEEEIRKESVKEGALKIGEDMAFSQRVKDCGYKIYVDFGARASHMKLLSISWDDSNLADIPADSWHPHVEDYGGV